MCKPIAKTGLTEKPTREAREIRINIEKEPSPSDKPVKNHGLSLVRIAALRDVVENSLLT